MFAFVLPPVEHLGGAHLGVRVERYPAVQFVPPHNGAALVVDGAVAVDLGDGTRDQREARGARASAGESGRRGLEGERVRERRRERKGLVVKRRLKSKNTHFSLSLFLSQ